MIPLHFAIPIAWLLLVPGVVLTVLALRFSRVYLPPVRRRVSVVLRLALLALIVGALAQPEVQLPVHQLNVVFLVDASYSVGQPGVTASTNWIRQALQHIGPSDRAGVVVFGQNALVEQPLSHLQELPTLASTPKRGYTDIARAIRLGLAMLASSTGEKRLVLLSDGNENLGSAMKEAQIAVLSHVQISVVPIEQGPRTAIFVDQLTAPATLRQGERFAITATIQSTATAQGTLYLFSDGGLSAQEQVQLHPGTNTFRFTHAPETQGFHTFQVRLNVAQDPVSQDKTASAFSYVTGPPRILLVEGKAGEGQAVQKALAAAGMIIQVVQPSGIPTDLADLRSYDSVVLVNVPATALAPSEMDELKLYVQNLGGGLVTIGGDHSYGPGQYEQTTLDELLPVSSQVKPRKNLPSTAVVFIIESLENSLGVDISKEAAKAAIGFLTSNDQVAVNDANGRWTVPLQAVTNRQAIDAKIDGMDPGDPSSYVTAFRQSLTVLQQATAKVKHIILIGDGDAYDNYQPILQQITKAGITVSVVGTNVQPSDLARLQQIAQWGHGRYYDGNDPFDIPQLLVKETQVVARPAIVQQTLTPTVAGNSPVLQGVVFTHMPPLQGYVATTLKGAAEQLMVSPEGDPLLARWQFGLGHVVSWTSDSGERWATHWVSWSQWVPFWSRVVQASFPSNLDQNVQVSLHAQNGQLRITVDSMKADQTFQNFLDTQAMVIGPTGQQEMVHLQQTAPGRYEGAIAATQSGAYLLQIVQKNAHGQVVGTKPTGYAVGYSPEYRDVKANLPLLESLVHVTAGKVLVNPHEAFRHDLQAAERATSLWPWLLLLAPFLLLADVAVRRLRVSPLALLAKLRGTDRRSATAEVFGAQQLRKQPASGGKRTVHSVEQVLAARAQRGSERRTEGQEEVAHAAVTLASRLQQQRERGEHGLDRNSALANRRGDKLDKLPVAPTGRHRTDITGSELREVGESIHSRLLRAKERQRER